MTKENKAYSEISEAADKHVSRMALALIDFSNASGSKQRFASHVYETYRNDLECFFLVAHAWDKCIRRRSLSLVPVGEYCCLSYKAPSKEVAKYFIEDFFMEYMKKALEDIEHWEHVIGMPEFDEDLLSCKSLKDVRLTVYKHLYLDMAK
jgi:hypothetical protein